MGFPLHPGVDVLGVLAEDDDVHILGPFHGRRYAGEVAHGSQTDVQVEHLAESDVEAADPPADGRGERAFDPDDVLPECLDGLIGQPIAGLVERFCPGQNFLPLEFARAGVGLFDHGVEDAHRRGPDVRPGAVAFNKGDNWIVRDVQSLVGHRDRISHRAGISIRGRWWLLVFERARQYSRAETRGAGRTAARARLRPYALNTKQASRTMLRPMTYLSGVSLVSLDVVEGASSCGGIPLSRSRTSRK